MFSDGVWFLVFVFAFVSFLNSHTLFWGAILGLQKIEENNTRGSPHSVYPANSFWDYSYLALVPVASDTFVTINVDKLLPTQICRLY